MKCLTLLAILAGFIGQVSAQDPLFWNFENIDIGQLPDTWFAAKTGDGDGSRWQLTVDADAKDHGRVLSQISDKGPRAVFNLCIADEVKVRDLKYSLSFRANKGHVDQGGGPLWRYQDENNYYVARANPLENNFRVYKVVNGNRTQLASANVETPSNAWHTIEIVHRGDHIQCALNGKVYLDLKDSTFPEEGRIGVWTKADAQTSFDNLQLTPLP